MASEPEIAPPYDGAPRSIAILKAAASKLRPFISLAQQAAQIEEWSRHNASRWPGTYAVSLDRKKWHRFVSREATYTSKERDLPKLAWFWFFETHRHAIEPLWQTMPDHHPKVANVVAAALHGFLSPERKDIDLQALALLEGEYAVYRPSFMNPDDIMVMSMTCGVGGDPSRFTLDMAFADDEGDLLTEQAEGFAVPYQDCILFQGRLLETGAPFIFVMSSFPVEPKTGKYSRGDGTLLVGARGTVSSAYPITMRRSSKPVRPETLDQAGFMEAVRGHSEILKFFSRGIVGWR